MSGIRWLWLVIGVQVWPWFKHTVWTPPSGVQQYHLFHWITVRLFGWFAYKLQDWCLESRSTDSSQWLGFGNTRILVGLGNVVCVPGWNMLFVNVLCIIFLKENIIAWLYVVLKTHLALQITCKWGKNLGAFTIFIAFNVLNSFFVCMYFICHLNYVQ